VLAVTFRLANDFRYKMYASTCLENNPGIIERVRGSKGYNVVVGYKMKPECCCPHFEVQ
jgi:hypothetical protein